MRLGACPRKTRQSTTESGRRRAAPLFFAMMAALRQLGERPLSISKYCVGLALMNEDLRSSRLAPALRAIERVAA